MSINFAIFWLCQPNFNTLLLQVLLNRFPPVSVEELTIAIIAEQVGKLGFKDEKQLDQELPQQSQQGNCHVPNSVSLFPVCPVPELPCLFWRAVF